MWGRMCIKCSSRAALSSVSITNNVKNAIRNTSSANDPRDVVRILQRWPGQGMVTKEANDIMRYQSPSGAEPQTNFLPTTCCQEDVQD